MQPGDCVAILLPRSIEVYSTILATLKAGAAYVPLDPAYPASRVTGIVQDSQARVLLTDGTLAQTATGANCKLLLIDELLRDLESFSGEPLNSSECPPLKGNDLCYIIYTSGTTGQPKGVEITHASARHLVETEAGIFQVQPADRVYQGFSIAFDASVEEIWLAFNSGATLLAGTVEMMHAGPGLARMLTAEHVTVLSCVPTLLAMLDDEIPTLRLLILGGEVCPPELVRKWWRPDRRVYNTYGPTEATVVATYAECSPAKPVTIGRPLPGYEIVLLDSELRPVSANGAGELCIGGPGLARGYRRRPELTAEKFIDWSLGGAPGRRLYRSGDLARWNPQGDLEFLGRIDSQVKLRGFRIELAEIEAVLMQSADIKAAAAAVREDVSGLQQLVAYIVAQPGREPDRQRLRTELKKRLPPFMVPVLIEVLESLPTLPSGKLDRKALPPPRQTAEPGRELQAPRNAAEQQLADCWGPLFGPAQVSVSDNFFLDLGGHSLLAARMVSQMRRHPGWEHLSMLEVYRYPTIEQLAAHCARTTPSSEPDEQEGPGEECAPVSRGRHFLCGLAQAVSLVFLLSFYALQWLAPYLTYTILVDEEWGFWPALMGAFASVVLVYPVMLVGPVLSKWLLIGRYKPGRYPLWGFFYFRWWLVTTIEAAVPVGYLSGTPLLNIYLRLMGARIGRNVHLDSDSFAIFDLLSIGDDSSINVDSNLLGYTVENGWLKLGSITIGKRCFVGARAALREDTVMEDDSALEDLSLLPRGGTIPQGQHWCGSPATATPEPNGAAEPQGPAQVRYGAFRRFSFGVLYGLAVLLFPVLVVGAIFPGIVVMNELNYLDPYYWYLLLAPLVGLSFVVLLSLEIAALKWLLLGKVRAGIRRLHSFYYLRKWFVDQTMDLSLDTLGPLYASVYLAPWYRLLGARLGKGAEVSTASFISPDLLDIGEDSFIADSVSLGAPRVCNGTFSMGANTVGKRSFIGNSALLPPGTVIADDVLLGCLSIPPKDGSAARHRDSTWLGSPALYLPQRAKTAAFSEETTFKPSASLRAQRAAIEFVRVITPSTCFIILLSLLFSCLLLLHDEYTLTETLLYFPPLYLACCAAAAGFAIAAKWVLVGRYRAGERPLWSRFVWRNELVNALHEHLAEPFLAAALTGTPFLPWYFRLLGARIGRRVYMETTDFSEFDLAEIGDEAALNSDCTIQTHLFEDRVMKMSHVNIGPRCTVGAGSLVLYDTRMEPGSALGDLSLLMKGEVLPPNTQWQGIPARGTSRTPASSRDEACQTVGSTSG